jgi:hypothetical protein
MKKLLVSLLILFSATMMYAQDAAEPEVYCTIMFDFYGTPDEARNIATKLMQATGSPIVAQFRGSDKVIYCETPENCTLLEGQIMIIDRRKNT